jgi:hypothetical protein
MDRTGWTNPSHSHALEIDPATKNIVWRYQESIPSNFFSPRISNAQRLPNGNTLINEGYFGRFFEVTADGNVVWEYVSPYFGGAPNAQRNAVFRVYRYTAEEIPGRRRRRGRAHRRRFCDFWKEHFRRSVPAI